LSVFVGFCQQKKDVTLEKRKAVNRESGNGTNGKNQGIYGIYTFYGFILTRINANLRGLVKS
jgi:hypothetical protein